MRKFYKSLIFLFILDSVLFLVFTLLLGLKFMILVGFFVVVLNLYLCFFIDFHLTKTYVFSAFPPDDSYGVSVLFEQLKAKYQLKYIQLLNSKELDTACFCWNGFNGSKLALSEDILENFSQQEISYLISYNLQKIKSGEIFFTTLLSSFLFGIKKIFYVLSYPLLWTPKVRKYSTNPENPTSSVKLTKKTHKSLWSVNLVLKIMSLVTVRLVYKNDKELFFSENKTNEPLVFLWKLDHFVRLKSVEIPLFLSPLFPINPLTAEAQNEYISLQPSIKKRVKKLTLNYPP